MSAADAQSLQIRAWALCSAMMFVMSVADFGKALIKTGIICDASVNRLAVVVLKG